MDIGKPQRVIMVEPLKIELPLEVTTEEDPAMPEPAPAAPAPQRRHHPTRSHGAQPQPSRDH